MANYKTSIVSVSKELTPVERIKFKDTTDAEKLDVLTQEGRVVIEVDYYGKLHIVNPNSDDKEYEQFVIVGKDGRKYVTGSASFQSSFENITIELEEAGVSEFSIVAYRLPSKKREGKEFITCSLA